MLGARRSGRLISLISGNLHEATGHLAMRRSGVNGCNLELLVPLGETAQVVTALKTFQVFTNGRNVSYLGPQETFQNGGFSTLGLTLSAVIPESRWAYAISVAGKLDKEGATKAMAYFVPDSLATQCGERFLELGLARKRKHRRDSSTWAVPADLAGITTVDRHAGVFAVNPSLVTHRLALHAGVKSVLINLFDPAAEDFAEGLLANGFEFAGLAPQFAGIDYLVLTRAASHPKMVMRARQGGLAPHGVEESSRRIDR